MKSPILRLIEYVKESECTSFEESLEDPSFQPNKHIYWAAVKSEEEIYFLKKAHIVIYEKYKNILEPLGIKGITHSGMFIRND